MLAGVSVPTYVEPSLVNDVALDWIEASASVSYFTDVRAGIPSRFGYANVSLTRTEELTQTVLLSASAGYGYKLFFSDHDQLEHDVQVDAQASFTLDRFTVTPAVHWAWCNFGADSHGKSVPFSREHVAWGSFEVSFSR
jgi:hypothetical protein